MADSWFNLYKRQNTYSTIEEFEKHRKVMIKLGYKIVENTLTYYKDEIPDKELDNLNKFKKIMVYDDVTGEIIPTSEITELEEFRNCSLYPDTITSEVESNKREIIVIDGNKRKGRKKIRIPVSPQLRKAVLKRYENRCVQCGLVSKSNQIHHIDENPANNNIDNLELLCYECHISFNKKQVVENH